MKIDPAEIIVEDRFREDPSIGIKELSESIRDLGQLQPIVVDGDFKLIDGERRLLACISLGIDVAYVMANNLDDAERHLRAERDANQLHMQWTPSEAVAIGKRLESLLKPEAEKREKSGVNQHTAIKEPSGKFTEGSRPQVRDQVAAVVGMSGPTYEKAKAVVETGTPDLVDAMNAKRVSIDTAAKMAAMPEATQKEVLAEAAKAPNPRKAAAKAVAAAQVIPERPHFDDCIKFQQLFDKLCPRWTTEESKQVMRQFFRQKSNEV